MVNDENFNLCASVSANIKLVMHAMVTIAAVKNKNFEQGFIMPSKNYISSKGHVPAANQLDYSVFSLNSLSQYVACA